MIDPLKVEPSYLFSVIGERNRLKIIHCLLNEAQTVDAIRRKTKIEKTLLSKHLKVLRSVGLVLSTRSGKSQIYRLSSEVTKPSSKNSLFLHCCEIRIKPT
jgi:DNA-binding transcriptional ArsR family regulator